MDDKKRDSLSRRERYNNVEPGGYSSRNIESKNNSENRVSNIRRTAPSRLQKYAANENHHTRQGVKQEASVMASQNRISQNKRISRPVKKKNSKIWPRLLRYFLYLASIGIISIFLVCVYWIYQAPEFDSSLLDNNTRTVVYDKNDKEVAKLGSKIGDEVELQDVPEQMQNAILATEDNRFFEHGAIDYQRLAGAMISNLTSGFGSQGGSTISQQLIKRTFLNDNKNIKRKVQEAYLAYKLEQNYSKENIFAMYINRIYYSDGVYGLKTAANYYYGKDLKELSLPQMALLAGLPQQPNAYNPYDYPEAAKSRRDTVLYLMQYHGKITEEEAKAAQQVDILDGIVVRNAKNRFMLSSEFDPSMTAYMSQVAYELNHSSEFEGYEGDVLNLGLKVYTNLDTDIQKSVYNSMSSNLANIKQSSDVAMVVLDNSNSGIAALYGGKEFAFGGFNFATQSKLQPGSAIKPILAYGPAIEYLGWSTNHMIEDKAIPGSQIQNWDRQFHGNVTMNYALMMSLNIPAIKTFQEVGFNNVKKYANNVGMQVTDDSITTPIGGSADGYSPLQMAAAYVPFSNGGYYASPKTVRKVFDNNDEELSSFSKSDRKQVIKDTTSYIMTSMLRNVLGGTATLANVAGADMRVKTGTTTFSAEDAQKYGFDEDNASKDSWIIGYTSNYTMAVWQGFDKIDSPTKFMTVQDTGKTQILYRINMQNIVKLYPPKPFNVPSNVGTYNGGLKVLTESEKNEIAEQERKAAEEAAKKAEEEKNKQNEAATNSNNSSNNTNTSANNNTTNSNTNNTNNTTNTSRTNG